MKETTSTQEPEVIVQASKNVKGFHEFFNSQDWDKIFGTVVNKVILVILLLIFLLIVKKMLFAIVNKSFENYQKKDNYSENRVKTLRTISDNAIQYSLFFVGLYSVLTIIGVPVASLIAGAGIAGIAIGLGAQGFINDIITGFFLIYERQLDVGDYVIIDSIEGTVDDIGLRTTKVKSSNGTMNYIPNREILVVSNLSRGNQQICVDIRVHPDDDIDKIISIMEKVNEENIDNLEDVRSKPQIIGLTDLGNGNFAIRASVYVISEDQVKVKSKMTTAYVEALTNNGISIPTSPINLSV
ncbi:mechanosensitive ion channel family protein [Vagococcus jeotgali]|uniref:mechanosensitive ion channel family protein n=1 Tax=Vagococcus jeotgali TaxID=3109030 RepID=UPI002DD97BF6|nr:mechanosensitive ion channel family protein [Vagococcus sp. B2T-5]